MSHAWPRLTLLVAAMALVASSHTRLDSLRPADAEDHPEALPTPSALALISFNQQALLTDWYWLRAISHYGDRRMHKRGYPLLLPLMERVLSLDPRFAGGYVFALTALTMAPFTAHDGLRLAQPALDAALPDWRIPFLAGFVRYYDLADYAEAARLFARTAQLPGAPDYVGPLATRLAAESGEPEIGLQLIDAVLAQLNDPAARATYEERRRLLQLEAELKWLTEALRRFRDQSGRGATRLEELVAAGLLTTVPTDPLGGVYYLDDRGQLATTSESKRLRLKREPGGRR